MIQRIQSIFLTLIALLSIALLFLPFAKANCNGEIVPISLNPLNFNEQLKSFIWAPFILVISIIVLSLINIFSYRNRVKQIKLCRVLMIDNALLSSILLTLNYFSNCAEKENTWFALIPVLNIFLALMAQRFISKDEDLVRSADRLR